MRLRKKRPLQHSTLEITITKNSKTSGHNDTQSNKDESQTHVYQKMLETNVYAALFHVYEILKVIDWYLWRENKSVICRAIGGDDRR
jgi:hypothetical protein